MKKIFKVPIGFSDHTTSNEAALVATSLGAEIIEKHFTLDKTLVGPDHALSSDPEEFKSLVKSLKIINTIKGNNYKKPVEKRELTFLIRRSLFVNRTLKPGEKIKNDDIIISRPARGIEPKHLEKIVGKKIIKSIKKGSALNWSHFKKA